MDRDTRRNGACTTWTTKACTTSSPTPEIQIFPKQRKPIQTLLGRRAPVVGSDGLQISNDPKRRKLGAMRDTTEQRSMTGCPVYSRSRSTRSSLVTTLPARVVGMPCRVYSLICLIREQVFVCSLACISEDRPLAVQWSAA